MRKGQIERKTRETEVKVEIVLDGQGKSRISSPIPFLNHMLELFSKHGMFDLEIEARGDVDVDIHHTVEDVGISLGRAVNEALAQKRGIRRFGFSSVPMDESLCLFSIDLGGRPYLVFNAELRGTAGGLNQEVTKEFFRAFSNEAKCAVHINLLYGENTHHMIEAIFKAFGLALREAATMEGTQDIPSAKGIL